MRGRQKIDSKRDEGKASDQGEFFIVDSMWVGGGDKKRKQSEKVASISEALRLVGKLKSSAKWVDVYYSSHPGKLGACRVLYLVLSVYVDFFDRYTIEVETDRGRRLLIDVGEWGAPLCREASFLRYERFPDNSMQGEAIGCVEVESNKRCQ